MQMQMQNDCKVCSILNLDRFKSLGKNGGITLCEQDIHIHCSECMQNNKKCNSSSQGRRKLILKLFSIEQLNYQVTNQYMEQQKQQEDNIKLEDQLNSMKNQIGNSFIKNQDLQYSLQSVKRIYQTLQKQNQNLKLIDNSNQNKTIQIYLYWLASIIYIVSFGLQIYTAVEYWMFGSKWIFLYIVALMQFFRLAFCFINSINAEIIKTQSFEDRNIIAKKLLILLYKFFYIFFQDFLFRICLKPNQRKVNIVCLRFFNYLISTFSQLIFIGFFILQLTQNQSANFSGIIMTLLSVITKALSILFHSYNRSNGK